MKIVYTVVAHFNFLQTALCIGTVICTAIREASSRITIAPLSGDIAIT